MFAESCTIQIIIWNGVCLSTADPPIVDSKFVFPMFFFIYEQITLGPCVMSWPGQQCSIDQIFFLFIPASCFQLQFTLTPNWICIFFIMWISINFLFLHFWQRHTISESIYQTLHIVRVLCAVHSYRQNIQYLCSVFMWEFGAARRIEAEKKRPSKLSCYRLINWNGQPDTIHWLVILSWDRLRYDRHT